MSTENRNFPPANGQPSPEKIRQALSGAAGQRLIRLLRSADPRELQRALTLWQQGDAEGAKAVLTPIVGSAEAAELLGQVAEQANGGA